MRLVLNVMTVFSAIMLSTACAEEEARWPLSLHGQDLMPLDTSKMVSYLNIQDTLDTMFLDYGQRIFDFEGENTDLREFVTQQILVSHSNFNEILIARLENFGAVRSEFLSIGSLGSGQSLDIMLEFPSIMPAGETQLFPFYLLSGDSLKNVLSNPNQTPQLLYRLNQGQSRVRGEIIAVKVNEQYYRKN